MPVIRRCERCGAEIRDYMSSCPICGYKEEGKEQEENSHVFGPKTVISKKIIIGLAAVITLLSLMLIISIIMNIQQYKSHVDYSPSEAEEHIDDGKENNNALMETADDGNNTSYYDAQNMPEEDKATINEDSSVEETISDVSDTAPMEEITSLGNQPSIDSSDIHKYLFIHDDVSWEEAWNESITAGGYLARINSPEEYNHIVEIMDSYTSSRISYVYLGGIRDNQFVYHWRNDNGGLFDEDITSSWYTDYWYPGEPSYYDPEEYKSGNYLPEYCVCLMHVDDAWYMDDSNGDLPNAYKDGYGRGRIGYLIEFEN